LTIIPKFLFAPLAPEFSKFLLDSQKRTLQRP